MGSATGKSESRDRRRPGCILRALLPPSDQPLSLSHAQATGGPRERQLQRFASRRGSGGGRRFRPCFLAAAAGSELPALFA